MVSRAMETVPISMPLIMKLKNAFMACLPGLNIYPLLTVDLLHEFELGVWKALFTHIIRILSLYPGTINELDKRYTVAQTRVAHADLSPAKVPPHQPIWKGCHPPILEQRIPDEETCCPQL
jgi:hypothetical protein